MRIGVVGPCAAGKTTLIEGLITRGYDAKQIAQEHSYVQDMWLRITNPDVLIFLDVSYSNSIRRKNLNWTEREYKRQQTRLTHAQNNADLYINTDRLTPQQVLSNVLEILNKLTID